MEYRSGILQKESGKTDKNQGNIEEIRETQKKSGNIEKIRETQKKQKKTGKNQV